MHVFVTGCIDYCNAVLFYAMITRRLQSVLSNLDAPECLRNYHVTSTRPIGDTLHWLPVSDSIDFNTAPRGSPCDSTVYLLIFFEIAVLGLTSQVCLREISIISIP